MPYIPIGNNLFVEPMRRTKSAGGVHLLDDNTYSGDTMEFMVLAVGPGRVTRKGFQVPIWPEVKPGDIVISPAYQAQAFEVQGHTVRVLDVGQVLAVIERQDAKTDAAH